MKLADLKPKWIQLGGWASRDPFWVGVSFLCPHCGVQRLHVMFTNAIDPTGFVARHIFEWPPRATEGPYASDQLCLRTGETFATLTITPPFGYLEWRDHGGLRIDDGEVRTIS